jgi:hypothetical protein
VFHHDQVFDHDDVGEHEFLGQLELWGNGDAALPIYEASYPLGARANPGASMVSKLFQRDWHVGGEITIALGCVQSPPPTGHDQCAPPRRPAANAVRSTLVLARRSDDEEATRWGISGQGRLMRLTDRDAAPAVGEPGGPAVYRVVVFTARAPGAGCAASVFIQLWGEKVGKRTPSVQLVKDMLVEPKRHMFGSGEIDMFEFEEQDVGELLKIKIGHDNSARTHDGNSWLLEKVTVENTQTGVQWLLPAARKGPEDTDTISAGLWFDHKKGDGKVKRELHVKERKDKRAEAAAAEAAAAVAEGEELEGAHEEASGGEPGSAAEPSHGDLGDGGVSGGQCRGGLGGFFARLGKGTGSRAKGSGGRRRRGSDSSSSSGGSEDEDEDRSPPAGAAHAGSSSASSDDE